MSNVTYDIMPSSEKTGEDPAYARGQLPFSQNNRKFRKLFGKISQIYLKNSEVPSEMLLFTSFPDQRFVLHVV